MATKRPPIRPTTTRHNSYASSNLNFRPGGPDVTRGESKGTRPTAPPTSVREILVMMVMHVCKKTIFFDTNLKVALYLGSLFLISLIGDFIPFPKTYFARSDNLFNQYFVKIGWFWTLLFSIPFLLMTSFTLCCGDIKKMLQNHLPRIFVATFFWFFWTKLFNIIETTYGRCNVKGYYTKSGCLKAGYLWSGFDISGHAFILIYSSLVLIEEARPIIKWETIKEYLRNELHDRSIAEHSSSNPLRYLNEDQMKNLKFLYERLTPMIRTIFIGMSALQLLWDIMLVSTMLYYHRMIEKVLSGIIAILTWYFTYRFWFRSNSLLPDPAGCGSFIYQRENKDSYLYRQSSMTTAAGCSGCGRTGLNTGAGSSAGSGPSGGSGGSGGVGSTFNQQIPKFMGMPLFTSPRAASAAANAQISNQTNDKDT